MRKFLFLSNKNSDIWLKEQFCTNHWIFRRITKFLQNFWTSIAFRIAKILGLGTIDSIDLNVWLRTDKFTPIDNLFVR